MRQSHNGQRLPALFANNLKINFNFMLANPLNPLKQGISHNHKQEANPTAKGNFQAPRKPNHQGTKLPSVQNFPLSEGRKQSEGRKKKQRNEASIASKIHSPS
jgi:hypothetical protein